MKHIGLGLDELKALRLVDLEGLYQEDAAAQTNVSRPTFGRIIREARHKAADTIINGKALVIETKDTEKDQRGRYVLQLKRMTVSKAASMNISDQHPFSSW
jgi:predicted DNA-binding protein (UPF0251 family)